MVFRKLFHLLVVGGAVMGSTSGCSAPARAQQTSDKSDSGEGGAASAAAQERGADGGVTADAGSGVPGW